jgi:integrase
MRTVEALAMRIKDVDFTITSTRVHVRGEFAKTQVARDIFISDEAAQALKDWIDRKRRNRLIPPNGLIFQRWRLDENPNPRTLYTHASDECSVALPSCGV